MRLLFAIMLLFTVAVNSVADDTYMFRKLDITDGLSNYDVKTILKDSDGFLWVGTAAGLNKYDGNGFKQYVMNLSSGDEEGFVDDILSLKEDATGNIWVRGGDGSYAVYDRNKDDFGVDVKELLASCNIHVEDEYSVYIDSGRNICVITGSTMYYFNPVTRKLLKRSVESGLRRECIDISDDVSCLYLLLDNNEVMTVDKSSLKTDHLDIPYANCSFNHIYIDCIQGIWLFSDYENMVLYSRRPGEWSTMTLPFRDLIHYNGIRCMLDDRNGHVWIGTDHNGVYIYDQVKGGVTKLSQGNSGSNPLQSENVSCIYMDTSNTIWMGHNKAGISYHSDMLKQFENLGLMDSGDITSLLEDERGNLWIGTEGYGLYRAGMDTANTVKVASVSDCSIICLCEDSQGRIWVGGYGNGLYCIDGERTIHYTTKTSGLASDIVWDVVDDKYGNIWVATKSGTQCLDMVTGEFFSMIMSDGYPLNSMSLHHDPANNIIYAGSFYGFFKIDVASKRYEHHYSNQQGTQRIKQGIVPMIYKDRRNNLWLGHNQGLTVWNEKTDSMYYIDRRDGLCDNMIRSIIEDEAGRVWVSTSNGLSVLSIHWGSNGEFDYSIRNYTRRDGLKSSFF